ncbi:MAG: ATPase [Betaproteobacteria bacterium]|nr:ATPase [Betaproteobacteria bacterium]
MIRPRPARWFEALVARDDCLALIAALAATGAVELEAREGATLPEAFARLRAPLARLAEYRSRYAPWWPDPDPASANVPEPPAVTLERGLAALDAWSCEAEPLIRAHEANALARDEQLRWLALLPGLAQAGFDAGALARAGPIAQAALWELAPRDEDERPGPLLAQPIFAGGRRYALVLGTDADLDRAARQAAASHGRLHPVPRWITGDAQADGLAIERRLAELECEDRALRRRIDEAGRHHGLARELAGLARLAWVIEHVDALESGERFAWVTGWSSDPTGEALRSAAARSGARALIHLAPPPAHARAPLLFANPRWARAFEIFPRALGVPGATEADPTLVLAFAVPLLFGYMFGDVGQGLLVAAAGFALRHRTPLGRLLVAGGLSAVAFGFVFGSVFSLHGAIPALWTDPLADPVAVLAVPLVAGAAFLAIGLVLHALGSYWRGETARLLGEDLGLLAIHAGLGAGFVAPEARWLALAGAFAFVAGHAVHARSASAALAGLGELAERVLQLAINTLSFARVGAFALAHAGLSSAVSALAEQAEGGLARIAILVAGNALVIVLEALVVSIQATRLVLFEFFARFLTGAGRPFRPLAPPPSFVQEQPG